MKKILTILFLCICAHNYAQDLYPSVINFDVTNKTINDKNEDVWVITSYHFLLLNPEKAIDLSKFGNEESEFNVIASNSNKIVLEFKQPSKVIPKGRCAAGEEKGLLLLELNSNSDLENSTSFLTESCLWSIESISKQDLNSNTVTYHCENLQTSELYTVIVNTKEATIIKE